MTTITPVNVIADARSGTANENLQEIIDAGVSPGSALLFGQNQYQTPDWLAQACAALLPLRIGQTVDHVLDPQGASGNLALAVPSPQHFVIDIDNRFKARSILLDPSKDTLHRTTGNCVRWGEIAQQLYGDHGIKFACIVANPPFALRWKAGESSMDSTEWTWKFITQRLVWSGFGCIIGSIATLKRLGITEHPWAYLVQEFPAGGIWDDCDVKLGIVHFQHRSEFTFKGKRITKVWDRVPTKDVIVVELYQKVQDLHAYGNMPFAHGTMEKMNTVRKCMVEEQSDRSRYNIYLGKDGVLRTYLSTLSTHTLKREETVRLARIDNCHPLTLCTEKETRVLLNQFITDGIYTIEPVAVTAIKEALAAVHAQACPITPVTDFELVAYADDNETLTAKTRGNNIIRLTPGKKYDIITGTYTFTENFRRKKLHYDEVTQKTELEDHDCNLTGEDRYCEITDDRGYKQRFMDRPPEETQWMHPETLLWELFERPVVETVAEKLRDKYLNNLSKLRLHAMLTGFEYYPGQTDYLARLGCKDYALIAADVGCGKTVFALSMVAMLSPKRVLIIAPQGTMRAQEDDDDDATEYQASQWVQEIRRFAPGEPVFELFSVKDYRAVLHANGGEFPPGIYITYPQAYWQNDAFETIPDSWEGREEKRLHDFLGLPFPEPPPPFEKYISTGVGLANKHGIRCVVKPSLATVLGTEQPEWDMVIIDEAHLCCNLSANVTQNLLRLQPKYRYAMTATPIPNYVYNLFSLMGWLCVPDWYKDKIRNIAWPYAVSEIGRFRGTFMSTESDLTAQLKAKDAGKKGWKNVGVRESPIISSPARLLKLLKPTMAYISKEACNPDLMPCEIIDVRVPVGKQQGTLYAKWLKRMNYYPKYKHPLTIARVQLSRLRGVCASPARLEYTDGLCHSDFNPKTIAMLELVRDCLRRGEQVVVVCARVEQSNLIASRLAEARVPIARIDSESKNLHSAEANRFKRGDALVMLMGIKCAQGHSFDLCPNLIIGSLEWSYGSLHQAKGRVWRLNSKQPVKVWCVLHKNTIEELLFDRVATKQDAATICLRGMRVSRDFIPLEASEVLAEHIVDYSTAETKSEDDAEALWPKLRQQLLLRM